MKDYDLQKLKENFDHVHCDGARIFQALEFNNLKPEEFSKYADSISICFAKDLGSFMGSVLLGGNEFIE